MKKTPAEQPFTLRRRELLGAAAAVALSARAASTWSDDYRGARASTSRSSPVSDDAITALDASALSAAIAARELSCVEVMDAYLARIERLNPFYNALVSLADGDALRREAREADRDLARGRYRGWMHGMPHAVKDLADLKGFRNTSGSPIYRDFVSSRDAIAVERIRAAGAIFIGKTNVPEWGLGSQSYNPVFGVTGNAYDPALTAGGSSGGAACGLATQMLPVADGSDMMGSLRNPAAFNNVIGFRPSQGRVPSDKRDPFYQQLATKGPMGRSVRDVARLLETMAGYDPRAPFSLRGKPIDGEPRARRLDTVHLGWLGDYGGYLPMESGVMALCEAALAGIADQGCRVEPCAVAFDPARLWRCWLTFRHWTICAGAKSLYDDPAKRQVMKPELIWEIEGGIALTAEQLAVASTARGDWYRALLALFEVYDFLVLPTAQVFPFPKDIHWPTRIGDREMDTYHRWMEVVIGGTLSGCPVINLPAGFDDAGRPMGIQVIAPMGEDQRLLEFALAYEAHTDYLARPPSGPAGA